MGDIDKELEQTIMDRLSWDCRVEFSSISIEVKDRIAIITGGVPHYAASEVIASTAWSTQGIINVDNRLEIKYPDSITLPPDDVLKDRIEQLIRLNEEYFGTNVAVSVDTGIVKLQGTVNGYWKKTSISDLASHVLGVVDVIDELSVVPTRFTGDMLVAKDITRCLEMNDIIDSGSIDVIVENGIITLRGSVTSWFVRQAVLRCIENTIGVTEIKNEIVIEVPESNPGLLESLVRRIKGAS